MSERILKAARPTDYRDVSFKSRSEAILARSLDLYGAVWGYEPVEFKQADGWVFDFITYCRSIIPGTISTTAIEYKPAGPTNAYRKELMKRAGMIDVPLVLMVGCPFDATLPRYVESVSPDGIDRTEDFEFLFEWWQAPEIKSFRFDLRSEW